MTPACLLNMNRVFQIVSHFSFVINQTFLALTKSIKKLANNYNINRTNQIHHEIVYLFNIVDIIHFSINSSKLKKK
jgi:hypothetical protein